MEQVGKIERACGVARGSILVAAGLIGASAPVERSIFADEWLDSHGKQAMLKMYQSLRSVQDDQAKAPRR